MRGVLRVVDGARHQSRLAIESTVFDRHTFYLVASLSAKFRDRVLAGGAWLDRHLKRSSILSTRAE